jgi:hypothetical protein
MMNWDYRVVFEDNCYTIRTVYYDEHGTIVACSEKGIEPSGDSIEMLQEELDLLQAALKKPVLSVADLPAQTHPPQVKRGKSLSAVRAELGLQPETSNS